jgi:ligand-binding sensor domain-containing protein/AraC-like DNA-binding protein
MKNHHKTRYFVYLLILITSLNTMSQEREWERITLFDDANTVFSLIQSSQGLIWFGTSQGLYDFDGYSCHPHFQVGDVSNSHIYCGVEIGKKLYLGSELGVLIYDMEKDEYLPFNPIFPLEVRALAIDDQKLWIGTLYGLYCYDLSSNTMLQIADGIPHQAIYALMQATHGDLYIGTYNGLCLRSKRTGRIEQITLPHISGRSNIFVNTMAEDKNGENIWIGVEGALYRYHVTNKQVEEVPSLAGNSVKSLAINDQDDVIVGTDNGLYIHSNGITSRYNHDSRHPKSLSNDVIWSVLVDKDNNIWAGTEYDVSLAIDNQAMEIISIGHLTGRGDGNRFFTIFRDSHNNLWLGGSNGIIRYRDGHSRWYMMGDKENTISHNRIRDIYEDSKKNLWVATDGSINRYDYDQEQFVTFRIIDENGQFNANWAYKILEDANHNLWIGSYLGGVHVIQNERILVPNKEIIADKAYNSTNGFPNNLINQIIIDANEDKWILFYKDGHLLKIENKTDKIQMYDLRQQLGMLPMFLITDTQDRLWCGFQGGVALLDKAGKMVKKLSFSEKGNENIKDIELVESNLWVATSQEVWLVNTDNATLRMLPLPNRIFTAIYHDHHEDKVILGSVDEIIRVAPSIAYETREARPLCITSISVNDNPYRSGTTPRLLDKLHLNHTQKRITIQFSDLNYALHSKPRYEYRLTGMQPQWSILPENQNLITISNLKPGKYTLQIRPVNIATELFSFDINMAQPWFNTGLAWTTYLILIVALILGVSHYSRVQKRLRKERAEKEEQLEAARETIRNMVSINTISTSKPLELLSVDEKMLAEVAQVVETNMANPDLNVNFVCKKTGISTKQLYRKIKQYLGITPVEFIRQIRLRKAAQLLEQKKFTVSEVMYMVGFSSPGYFSKCFATQFGCTPRNFLERPEC